MVGCAGQVDSRGFDTWIRQHPFIEIGHEIKAILSLLLIQVGPLSVTGERIHVHLVLVNCLGSLPRNSVVSLTDRLDMTVVVDWDVKPQIKPASLATQASDCLGNSDIVTVPT